MPTVNYLISEEIFLIDSVCWKHFVLKERKKFIKIPPKLNQFELFLTNLIIFCLLVL